MYFSKSIKIKNETYRVTCSNLKDIDEVIYSQIVGVDRKYDSYSWSEKSWNESRKLDSYKIVDARNSHDDLIGFSLLNSHPSSSFVDLLKIIILPDYRRLGVATELLGFVINSVFNDWGKSSINLEVSDENREALNLYLKKGFTELRRVNSFYSDGKNAIIMQLS